MRVAQFDELRQKPRHYCDKSHANRSQTTGFVDFNKRTSRLAANLPLFRANLCPLTFVDVPEQAYSRATLGVYELTRVELLRDLYVWAYERSTQEHLAIKQELAEPDKTWLAHRELIKHTIREEVRHPHDDTLVAIAQAIAQVP